VHYLIALRLNQSLQRVLVDEETGCWILNDGIEVIAFDYQALSWKKTHRVIGIRQKIDERPDIQGKTLSFFTDQMIRVLLNIITVHWLPIWICLKSSFSVCIVAVLTMKKTISRN
jgi:hypothetical protein